jgi:gas vesicle protein
MGEKKAVRVNIAPERKEEWERVAEETNRNLSDTIRKAMNDLIMAHDGDGSTDTGSIPESVEEEIYSTSDTVDNLHEQINQINSRFEVIESEIRTDREVRTVASEIYEILPDAKDVGSPYQDTLVGTTEWIVDMMGETEAMVEQAVEQLLRDNYHVHEIEPDSPNRRLYKEDR